MLKNIGLFCKRDLQKRPIFCKETYIFKHPTHRSHPIYITETRLTLDSRKALWSALMGMNFYLLGAWEILSRWKFSRVSSLLDLLCNMAVVLTFEKFYLLVA